MNESAERVNADFGVHGRCRRGGVAKIVLGSVSQELVLDRKLPVFLIATSPRGK
jgi:nucleotide-binding universal stress UspA family protein